MAYRRGFKSEANAIAREVRAELGLWAHDRLDPWELAPHLDVRVIALSAFGGDAPQAVRHFTEMDIGAFSACTVFAGRRRTIVHNDRHSFGRQVSNVTHELSHALLLHDPTPALNDRGCRFWNQSTEDEAQWLAGALLVTEDAALRVARGHIPPVVAAQELGVSERMIVYRLNVTGARQRVARSRHLWIGR